MITTYVEKLESMHSDLRTLYISKNSVKKSLEERLEGIRLKLSEVDILSLEKAGLVLNKVSKLQRENAKDKLQKLCTHALQYSLSPNYEMIIELGESRGKPSAEVFIRKIDTNTLTEPVSGNGGGVIDIISMAIRVMTIQIHEPFIDGPIILDEPYKMVSKEYIPLISDFIKKMSEDLGRQIILCTHNEFLAQIADKQILVSNDSKNESVVREL